MEQRGIYEQLFGPIVKWVFLIIIGILTVGIAWILWILFVQSTKGKSFFGYIWYVITIPFRIIKAYVMDIVHLFTPSK